MKILFLHPEDSPEGGPWAREHWDRVVDLGMATPSAYNLWSEFFRCPVVDSGFASLEPASSRQALAAGLGVILDQNGIDWWEVLCEPYTQRLYEILALQAIVEVFSGEDLFVSRDCFQVQALEALTNFRVHVLGGHSGTAAKARSIRRKLRRLSWKQMRQIVADKYDPEHKVRSVFAGRRRPSRSPVVLIPTAYVNVSRTGLAYAGVLPERQFLLVAARRSGWQRDLPENVAQADLGAYFRQRRRPNDHDGLIARIPLLKRALEQDPLCRVLGTLRLFESLETNLRRWLFVRDAWINVFDSESLMSVLCCDGTNPYTLIPLLIAKGRGIPAVIAHHGALDGHYLFKRCPADYILAKGEMERDYLMRHCRIPSERILIGAPFAVPPQVRSEKPHIVFFSEDYEVSGARVAEFYRSVLPPLAKLAAENEKELILKLHPTENLRDRRRIALSVLTAEEFRRLSIVEGPLAEDLMTQAWFAVAGISTTAVECAMRGVPVFLCAWLENWPCGYLDQFAKFGVGMKLSNSGEIQQIPALVQDFKPCDPRQLWTRVDAGELDNILTGSAVTEMAAAI